MEDTHIFYSSAGQRVSRCYLMRFEASRSDRLRKGSKSKNFDRFFTVEMAVRQCVGNAMPWAGANHAAFTAAHHTTRASAGWIFALDFFALKTRAGSVARADANSTSSTRSAWRFHVPRIWNRSMRPRGKNCQEKNTRYRRKSSSRSICSGVVSGHTS